MKLYRLSVLSTFFVSLNSVAAGTVPQLDITMWPKHIFWLIVIFSIFYILLKKVALPQVNGAISSRENIISDQLADAKHLFKQASSANEDTDKQLHTAQTQATKIREQARSSVQQDTRLALDELNQELDVKLSSAERDIDQMRLQAQQNIETIAADTAVSIVRLMTGKSLEQKTFLSFAQRKEA